jgi:eukaryotic-like serine/threonine-protein kinase
MRKRTHIPDPDPMIGRTIHEYKLATKLAEGGMGAVYLARHVVLPKLKVVKLLLPRYAATPALRQRFHREAKAASRLEHECILGIDNFGALDDGQLFIMVPYLDGQPLDAYLHSHGGKLVPHRALHLIAQLCDALDHAHSRGIIHRDLKPGNVFLVETSSNPCAVKLLDFGIAKVIGEQSEGPQTHSGQAMGTPSYMAVEQYEHADKVTHLADIYSLAVMIWEVVTGRLPWQDSDPTVLYHLQRTVIPERPPEDVMPPRWTEILLAALGVDPDARPQSARELAGALASALPAVGLVPSGAEILGNLVPRFVKKSAPNAETVRNASDVDRIGPLLWSPGTAPDTPRRLALLDVHAVPDGAEAPPAVRAIATAPEVNAPGPAPAEMLPTTLSAATSIATRPGERRHPRWKLALVAIGTAAVAAIATGSIATNVSSDDAPTPAPASAPRSAPAPRIEEATRVETQERKTSPHFIAAATAADSGAPRDTKPTKPTITVVTEPPGAVVRIDGSPRGKAPLTIPVESGRRLVIDAEHDGFEPAKQTITAEHEEQTVTLSLMARPTAKLEAVHLPAPRPTVRPIRPSEPPPTSSRSGSFDRDAVSGD